MYPRSLLGEELELVTQGSINQLINLEEQVVVLRTYFVKTSIINTRPPFSLDFLTNIILASHQGYCTLIINLAPKRLSTSSLIACQRSRANLRGFCFTSRVSRKMFRWYQATSGSIPSMSLIDHTNTFVFSLRKLISYTRFSSGSVAPILIT